jgi:hypothetical protein
MKPTPLRFFAVVMRPTIALIVSALAILGFGVFLLLNDPQGIDQAFALVLIFQMFAASTGFRDKLIRGHFDSIVVGGRRVSIALTHWLVSIVPGLTIWLVLAALCSLTGNGARPSALTPGGSAVFLYVSAVAWTVSLPLVRYAAGSLWIMTLIGLAATHRLTQLRAALLAANGDWGGAMNAVLAALACPLFLLADAKVVDGRIVGLVTVVAIGLIAVGVAMVNRFDAPLTDPS